MLSTTRALQIHGVVSALFAAPFFILGPAEFASMLIDNKIAAATLSKDMLLMHLFHVDAVKNVFITALAFTAAATFDAEAQRTVFLLNLVMFIALLPLFNLAPPHPDIGLPPPAIAYIGVVSTCYAVALFGPQQKNAGAKKKK